MKWEVSWYGMTHNEMIIRIKWLHFSEPGHSAQCVVTMIRYQVSVRVMAYE